MKPKSSKKHKYKIKQEVIVKDSLPDECKGTIVEILEPYNGIPRYKVNFGETGNVIYVESEILANKA